MARIAGVQTKNDPSSGRLKTLVLNVPKLMKSPIVSEALENFIDVLAVQAISDRNETGRTWEEVKKELDKKHSRVQSNYTKNPGKVFKKAFR
jgi:hypothetical protein